jgi:hypothetical protein
MAVSVMLMFNLAKSLYHLKTAKVNTLEAGAGVLNTDDTDGGSRATTTPHLVFFLV